MVKQCERYWVVEKFTPDEVKEGLVTDVKKQ
jgi:hypothetical protein